MAVTIAEPNDVEPGSLDDNNAILVYQQSSMGAGIRKLALADWRNYLGYNGQKVNNLESYTGMDPSYAWDDPNNTTPYTDDASKVDLTNRIKRLSEKSGISYAQPYDGGPTHERRISQLETDTSNLRTDLGTKPSGFNDAFTEIDNLKQEIGGPGSGSSTVTGRVQVLENTVDGPLNQPELGLKGIVNGFDSGDPSVHTIGLKEYVKDGYDVDEGGTPVHKPSLNEIVVNGYTEGGTPVNGLQTRVSTLETQMNGNSSTTPQKLSLYNTVLGSDGSGSTDTSCLNAKVTDLDTKINTHGVDKGLYEQTLGANGTDWNGMSISIASKVKDNERRIDSIESNLYTYKGDIYGVNTDSGTGNTVSIITDTRPEATPVDISTLENGWVYNIWPSVGDTLIIQINGTPHTYTKGSNIAWVKDKCEIPQGGHFDELGTAIDVSRIDNLETDVNVLNNRFGKAPTLTGWQTSGLTGIYQFSAFIRSGGSSNFYSFIASLENGTINATCKDTSSVSKEYSDLTNNFSDTFEVINNRIQLKSSVTPDSSSYISWMKISS